MLYKTLQGVASSRCSAGRHFNLVRIEGEPQKFVRDAILISFVRRRNGTVLCEARASIIA